MSFPEASLAPEHKRNTARVSVEKIAGFLFEINKHAKHVGVNRDKCGDLVSLSASSVKSGNPSLKRDRGKSVRSWCDGSSDRSFVGSTH